MDSLPSFLPLAVLLAPLIAAAGIAASGLKGDRSPARFWAKLGAGISFCSAVTVLLGSRAVGEPILNLGPWLSTGPHDAWQITLGLQLDFPAAGLAAVMSLATWCALAWSRSEPTDGRSERLSGIGASLLLFSSLGIVLSTNLAELFVFWQIAAVAGYLMSLAHAQTASRTGAAKKFIVTQRIADCLLLCAVFAFAAGFRTLEFRDLFGRPEEWGQLTGPRALLVELIGLCLLGACVGRCGLIPLLASAGELAAEPALVTVLVEGVCLMPAGVLLLIRCQPAFGAALATSSFAAFLGAVSAFAAAVCAWGADDVRRSAGYACASLFGIFVFGLATLGLASRTWGLVLLLAYIPTATVILGAFAAAAQEVSSESVPRRQTVEERIGPARWPLAASIILLFSGICGQGRILAEAVRLPEQPDDGGFATGMLTVALVALAQFFAAWAMMRAFLTGRGAERDLGVASVSIIETSLVGEAPVTAGRRLNWSAVILMCCGALIGLLSVTWGGMNATVSIAGCLPALSGLAAGWWQSRSVRSPWGRWLTNGALARLGRNRFYCDTVLFLFIVLPLRGVAQLARFFDWFVVDGFVSGSPASLFESATVLLEPIQRRSVAFYLLSMVFGTGLLAGVIVWLRNL